MQTANCILCNGSVTGLCKALPGTPENLVGNLPVVDSLPGGTLPVVETLAGIPAEGMNVLAEGTHTPAGGIHTPGCHTLATHDDGVQIRTWTANSGAGLRRDKCNCAVVVVRYLLCKYEI